MKRLIVLIACTILVQNFFSQDNIPAYTFHPPLDIPMFLSGNFAELRSDHFHSGIDIKTQGVTGKKVYSVEEGYVSRIKVQSNGYGNSVYINHPNGLTSQYGHLNSFSNKIKDYLESYQYRNQTFEVDIYLSPGDLPIDKGDVIAASGNTGSSGGPHLHFELRETSTQKPVNVLKYGFNIMDNISPRLYSLFMYLNEGEGINRTIKESKEYTLTTKGNNYILSGGGVLAAAGPVSFGIEGYDFLNGSNNRCGIYSLEFFVNGKLHFHFQTDKFSFAESRYLNAHIDYALKTTTGRRTHNLYEHPNEQLSMNAFALNNAVITAAPGDTLDILINAKDAYGNLSSLQFKLRGIEPKEADQRTQGLKLFKWYENNDFSKEGFQLNIPEKALYENIYFTYEKIDRKHSFYPFVHQVHSKSVPLQKSAEISFDVSGLPHPLYDKMCIVKIDDNQKTEYVGGQLKNGMISSSIREFGQYSLEVDTISPVIISLDFNKDENVQKMSSLRFRVKDDLSGLEQYKGFIDNQWILLQYDAKTSMLFYTIDSKRLTKGIMHKMKIHITDKSGNSNMLQSSFYW